MHVSQTTNEQKKLQLPPVLEGDDHDGISLNELQCSLRRHALVLVCSSDGLQLPVDEEGRISVLNARISTELQEQRDDRLEATIMREIRHLARDLSPTFYVDQLKPNVECFTDFVKRTIATRLFHIVLIKGEQAVEGCVTVGYDELLSDPRICKTSKTIFTDLQDFGSFGDALTKPVAQAISESRLPAENPKKEKPSKPKHASNPPTAKPANQEMKKMQTTASTHPLLASGKPLSIILPMYNGQTMLGSSDEPGTRIWTVLHKTMCLESMHAGDDTIPVTRHARQLPDFIGLRHLKSVKYGEQSVTLYAADLSSIQAQYSLGLRFIPRHEVEEVLSGASKIHDGITAFVFDELRSLLLPPLPQKQVPAVN